MRAFFETALFCLAAFGAWHLVFRSLPHVLDHVREHLYLRAAKAATLPWWDVVVSGSRYFRTVTISVPAPRTFSDHPAPRERKIAAALRDRLYPDMGARIVRVGNVTRIEFYRDRGEWPVVFGMVPAPGEEE